MLPHERIPVFLLAVFRGGCWWVNWRPRWAGPARDRMVARISRSDARRAEPAGVEALPIPESAAYDNGIIIYNFLVLPPQEAGPTAS